MFLPIGDEPNPRGVALVNTALLVANVAVFALVALPLSARPADQSSPLFWEYLQAVAQSLPNAPPPQELAANLSQYDLLVFQYGFRPAAPAWLTVFTSMFLHGGFAHVAGNMLFLWIYGDNVEARLGRLGYLTAYFGTGMAAALFHGVTSADSLLPTVGASGAISGVLGFYFVLFPRNVVRVFTVLFPFYVGVVRVRARWVLAGFVVLDNLLPFLAAQQGATVAYGAHLGGFVAGVAAALLLRAVEPGGRLAAYDAPAPPPSTTGAAASVQQRLLAGDLPGASSAYLDLLGRPERRGVPPEDALVLADWLAAQGHPHAAMAVYSRLLLDRPPAAVAARSHLGAGLVLLHALGQPIAAYQHLAAAREDGDADVQRLAGGALQSLLRRRTVVGPHA